MAAWFAFIPFIFFCSFFFALFHLLTWIYIFLFASNNFSLSFFLCLFSFLLSTLFLFRVRALLSISRLNSTCRAVHVLWLKSRDIVRTQIKNRTPAKTHTHTNLHVNLLCMHSTECCSLLAITMHAVILSVLFLLQFCAAQLLTLTHLPYSFRRK